MSLMNIRKTLGVSMLALATLAAHAFAASEVKSIDVTADLDAVTNPAAAKYWSNISADLKDAIAARLVDRIGDEGSEIKVDIDEVSLANSFQTAMGMEDAVISGQVNVSSETDNSVFDGYELTVSSTAASAFSEEGKPLTGAFSDTPEYYAALVRAFADAVVTRLK